MKSPTNRSVGVSLRQACVEFGTYENVLYELEHAGKLLGIRMGNRVIYPRAQLVALFGEPRTQPPDPGKLSPSVSGRQLSFEEIRPAAEAA